MEDTTFESRIGYVGAVAEGGTPDEAAKLLKLSRDTGLPSDAVKAMTPQEKALEQAKQIPWEEIGKNSPVYTRWLNYDPTRFALVSDDVARPGLLEKFVWTLPGASHQTKSPLGGVATLNGIKRAIIALSSPFALQNAQNIQDEITDIKNKLALAKEGKTAYELFGGKSDFDPTGENQYNELLANGVNRIQELEAERDRYTKVFSRINRLQESFPMTEEMADIQQAEKDGKWEWAKAIFSNLPAFIGNTAPESVTRQLPNLLALAAVTAGTGGAGAIPMIATGMSSGSLEFADAFNQGVREAGLNPANPEDVKKFITDPKFKSLKEDMKKKGGIRGAVVGVVDAITAGVASKTLLPMAKGVTASTGAKYAEMGTQMFAQGGLGSVGEALAQVASEGKITSLTDIAAEGTGGLFTAPIEVAAATLRFRAEAAQNVQAAVAVSLQTQNLVDFMKTNPLLQRDEVSVAQYSKEACEANGINTVMVNAKALHEQGADNLITSLSPEMDKTFQEALVKNEEVALPVEDFLTKVAPHDEQNALAKTSHPEGFPSLAQAQLLQESLQTEINERLSQAVEGQSDEFNASSQAVAESFRSMLDEGYGENNRVKAGGLPESMRDTLTLYYKTTIETIAKDLGMPPQEVHDRYGLRAAFGPTEVEQAESGAIQATSERAKELLAQREVARETALSHTESTSKRRMIERGLRAVQKVLDKSTSIPKAMARDGLPVDFEYGTEGGFYIKGGARKGAKGFLHILEKRWREDGLFEEEIRTLLDDLVYTIVLGKEKPTRVNDSLVLEYNTGNRIAYAILAKKPDNTAWVLSGFYEDSTKNAATRSVARDGATLPEPNAGRSGKGVLAKDHVRILDQAVRTRQALREDALIRRAFKQDILGDFLPDFRTIIQWAGANRSTFLHETGHLFLNMRVAIARDLMAYGNELTEGQKHLVDSIQDVMKWLGTDVESFSKMSTDEQRAMHEKFARTYEAYLMEGSAPTTALATVFRAFTSWLYRVYTVIKNIPGAEINDQVRTLFDNLFVSASEVEMARQRRAMFTRINDPVLNVVASSLGENLQQLQEDSVASAIEYQTAQMEKASKQVSAMREGKIQELTEESQRRYAEIYDKLWEETMNSPAYKAHVELSEGVNGVHPKLTMADIKDLKLTEAQIKFLENANMIGDPKEGTAAMVAEKYGFGSVDELVQSLLDLWDPAQHVRDLTTARMEELYGDLANEDAIKRSADMAIFNNAALRIMQIEASAFNRALGKKQILFKNIRESAQLVTDRMKVSALTRMASRYANYAEMDSRRCEKARRSSDIKEAVAAKICQFYHSAIVRAIGVQQKRMDKAQKFFKRFKGVRTLPSVSAQYLIQIQNVISKVTGEKFPGQEKVSLMVFIDEQNKKSESEDGDTFGVDFDLEFAQRIDHGEVTMETMTAEEFNQIDDLVRELYALGHAEATISNGEKRIELETARLEVATAFKDNAEKRGREVRENIERTGRLAKIKDTLEKIGFDHARVQSLLAAMEGTRTGKAFDYIVRTSDECGSRETSLRNEYTQKIYALLKPMLTSLSSQKTKFYKELGINLTKQQVFTMALNMGNEGNKRRLLDNSNGWKFMKDKKLTEADVLSIISQTLTSDEINQVQAIWDLFAELQKLIEAKEVKLRGRAPIWVEPSSVSMAGTDGKVVTLKGGYYPIVYDMKASKGGDKIEASKGVLQEMKAMRGTPSTWKGQLKTRAQRVDNRQPITLTLRALYEGFDNAIHDVCWDEWVGSSRRLLLNGPVEATIRDFYGAEAITAIRDWIRDIATNGKGKNAIGDSIANYMRSTVSLVGVGFNLVTAAIQPIAIVQSVTVLGTRWTLSGVSEFMRRGPMGAYRYAASKSRVMQDRARTQFRELTEVQRYTSSGQRRVYDGLARVAYTPVVLAQMLVDIPTWLGAYHKALAEGNSDARAVAIADRILIDTQGSGRLQDLSGIERGNAWVKLLTVFYTFFNTTFNLCQVQGRTQGKIKAARDLMLIMLAQPVMETFVREALKVRPDNGESDDEYWDRMFKASLANTVSFNFGYLVGLRELSGIAESAIEGSYRPYSGPSGLRKVTDIVKLSTEIRKAAEADEIPPEFAAQFLTVFAEISGIPLPVVPIARYLKGKKAIDEGKTDDWKAYLFGYTEK